ncbi:MAG: sensor histidine kinase [Bdellovibrionales bacterium]
MFAHKQEDQVQWLKMAHDLKSPLTALEVIVGRLRSLPAEESQMIEQAIGRIQDIVLEVLAPEPKAPRIWRARDVESLLKEKQLEFPSVVFSLLIDDPECELSSIDAVNLTRVLSNLLNNACEANFGEGEVQVRIRTVGGRLTIEIEDQGAGLSDLVRANLGELGNTSKPGANQRHGIGLYSAFQFAKARGGQLAFHNREGSGGTVVCLEL